jgi:sulfate adenylyltransferase subunit 2
VRLSHPLESRNGHQTVALLEAIEEHRFDVLMGGARRDEEKARAKERIFSHRDSFGQVAAEGAAPRAVDAVQHAHQAGRAHARVPDQQLDRARRVAVHRPREHPAAEPVLRARAPGDPPQGPAGAADRRDAAEAGETVETAEVRFRTVGDMTCTCPVESPAPTPTDIVAETLKVTISERGATRMDDRTSDASMERRKKEGYF